MFFYKIAILGANLAPLTYCYPKKLSNFQIVKVSIRNKISFGMILEETNQPKFKTIEILEITQKFFTSFQVKLAYFVASYYVTSLGIAFDIFIPKINQEEEKNKNEILNIPNLNDFQKKARDFALNNKTSLIFGDTGSGKSEIYFDLIAKTLKKNRQVLFLMPEISLTPQMTKRLKNYFGESFEIWHSKINPKKKQEILQNFYSKKINFIAGARSALFLPWDDLGLIIIDEEHDDSYKNANAPRYNARDLAIFAANKFENLKVVLGSATPSLTTFYKQKTFRLKGTFFESKKKFFYDENLPEISPNIIFAIKKCLGEKKQCVVFLPIRANFRFVICLKCGEIVKCPFCSVGMSFHKDTHYLKCHYCGYTTFFKTKCQKCGNETMENKKIGTSEVVKKLNEIFKTANIAKFDRDEITTQKKLEKLLNDFNSQKIDILVGTQMLSKGHDYHNVALVVIMGLDEYLSYPDFRAREKTLALAMQVSGRTGRKGEGKILIQTQKRDFFEKYIQNYDEFLKDEMEFRKNLYPPFFRIMRVLITHANEKTAQKSLDECLKILKNFAPKKISYEKAYEMAQNNKISQENSDFFEIIGYGKARIEFLAKKFRFEILLRAKDYKILLKIAKLCAEIPNTQIDMDAINFN